MKCQCLLQFFLICILIFFDFSRLLVVQVASGKGPEVPSEYSTRNVGSVESWKMQNNTTGTEGEPRAKACEHPSR